jgi:hypothetical protein
MLSVAIKYIMMSVVKLIAVMLNVAAPAGNELAEETS